MRSAVERRYCSRREEEESGRERERVREGERGERKEEREKKREKRQKRPPDERQKPPLLLCLFLSARIGRRLQTGASLPLPLRCRALSLLRSIGAGRASGL